LELLVHNNIPNLTLTVAKYKSGDRRLLI